jgi:hypothetical protein
MKTNRFTNALVGTAAILGVMSAGSLGARSQNVRSQATVSVKPAVAQESSGGMRDGVKVRGHWTIDVRNANGTLASHREFENALTAGSPYTGAGVIAQLLTNPAAIPAVLRNGIDWAVGFTLNDEPSGSTSCLVPGPPRADGSPSTIPGRCMISLLPENISNGVNLNGPNSGPIPLTVSIYPPPRADGLQTPSDKVSLSGRITMSSDGNITEVRTFLGSSPNLNQNIFSMAMLGAPVAVLANQVVEITVLFSFS